jgi:hypothetical protein
MTSEDAFAHALPLLYFYLSECLPIRDHAPALAPPIALASAGLLLALYLAARLQADDVACLAKDGWNATLVAQIRRDYSPD